jgi:hypothetical protein
MIWNEEKFHELSSSKRLRNSPDNLRQFPSLHPASIREFIHTGGDVGEGAFAIVTASKKAESIPAQIGNTSCVKSV